MFRESFQTRRDSPQWNLSKTDETMEYTGGYGNGKMLVLYVV